MVIQTYKKVQEDNYSQCCQITQLSSEQFSGIIKKWIFGKQNCVYFIKLESVKQITSI